MKQNGAMTKTEMYGQPASFRAINDTKDAIFATLDEVFRKGKPYRELLFTGCGTSLYLAQASAAAFTGVHGHPGQGRAVLGIVLLPGSVHQRRELSRAADHAQELHDGGAPRD